MPETDRRTLARELARIFFEAMHWKRWQLVLYLLAYIMFGCSILTASLVFRNRPPPLWFVWVMLSPVVVVVAFWLKMWSAWTANARLLKGWYLYNPSFQLRFFLEEVRLVEQRMGEPLSRLYGLAGFVVPISVVIAFLFSLSTYFRF